MTDVILTPVEAYDAMFAFLVAYWERGGKTSGDIAALLGSMNREHFFADRLTADPAQWHDWQQAIASTKQKKQQDA